jgi:hypothetical protein
MEDAGGTLTDIDLISGGGDGMSLIYDITPNGQSYSLRRRGSSEVFATKAFDVFDGHAAARERFDKINGLFLTAPAQGRMGHRIFLWVVTGRNRDAIPSLFLEGKGNPRKLAETDYGALLKMYHTSPLKISEDG